MTDPRDELLRLDAQLCFALVTASRNILSFYRPILEPLGLTHPQYLVMLALWERAPRSLHDLAEDLALDPATASPLVKRLEAQGLVRRQRRPGNERRLDITLTDRGEALRDDALSVPERVVAATGLSVDELTRIREALAPLAGRRESTA